MLPVCVGVAYRRSQSAAPDHFGRKKTDRHGSHAHSHRRTHVRRRRLHLFHWLDRAQLRVRSQERTYHRGRRRRGGLFRRRLGAPLRLRGRGGRHGRDQVVVRRALVVKVAVAVARARRRRAVEDGAVNRAADDAAADRQRAQLAGADHCIDYLAEMLVRVDAEAAEVESAHMAIRPRRNTGRRRSGSIARRGRP